MPGRRRERRAQAAFPRTVRVNEVLREVVADALERMADVDDRLRLVTVTGVQTSPDLSRATVYLSSMTEPATAALTAQRAQLQMTIARQVRLKRTPQLQFVPDPSVAHGQRVEEILRHLSEEQTAADDTDGGAEDKPGSAP